MVLIGRTLYYDKTTGNVLCDTGEREGGVIETTEAGDFAVYPSLQGVDPATVSELQLTFGQYNTEYQTSYISNVNPTTQALTWIPYPTVG